MPSSSSHWPRRRRRGGAAVGHHRVCDRADAGTLGDFTLDFTNFDPYVGMKFEVAIEDFDTKSKKGQFAFEPLTSGNDTVFIEGILRPLQYYTIALYADVDGDGACSPPPSDEVWYTQSDLTTESDENGDLTVSVSRPSIWETDTCDYFSGPVDPP